MELDLISNSDDSNSALNSKSQCTTPGKKRWVLLKNVLTASFLFKNHEVQVISDLDALVEDVKSSPTKVQLGRSRTLTSELINDHKTTEKLFFHISRSDSDDLIEINDLIENDPRRFARSKSDPESFVNKANINGIRPLYEACKNGYLKTVQLLLDHGANPHLLSELEVNDVESCLDVSSRWNHFAVVKCLLSNSSWTNSEIKKACRATRNKKIKEVLILALSTKGKGICGC
jgi:ankyrin repeat protein